MREFRIVQKNFTNKDNGKIIGFVEIQLITADFGAIKLDIPKDSKKVMNFLAKQNGFKVGELETKPDDKMIIFEG